MKKGIHILLVLAVFWAWGVSRAAAQEETPSLSICLEQAVKTHPLIQAAREDLSIFEAKYEAARLAWLPKLKLEGFLSATPEKTLIDNSDVGYAQSQTDYSVWGPYAKVEFGGALPLFTFGKISNLKQMARSGLDVGKAQVQIASSTVELLVVRAYLSMRLAHRMSKVLEDGQKYLERARNHLEKLREQDDEDYDDVDMLRLKVYESEVESRRLDANRLGRLSHTGLSLLTGFPEERFGTPGKLLPVKHELKEKKHYLELALEGRGEMNALRALAKAQNARISLERSRLAPDLFLGGFFSYSRAWAIDPIDSDFAYDPYNSWFAGAGLVLRWEFDIGQRLATMDEQKALARKVAAQGRTVSQKVVMEVAQAFAEVEDYGKKLTLDRKAHKAAQGWLIAKMDLYESGFADMKDLADALAAFFTRKLAYDQTVLEYNLAVARLAAACGVPLASFVEIE